MPHTTLFGPKMLEDGDWQKTILLFDQEFW